MWGNLYESYTYYTNPAGVKYILKNGFLYDISTGELVSLASKG